MVLPRIEMIDDDMVRVLRAMTGEERLRIASGMFTSARRMLASQLAVEHPDWDERQIQLEAARRLSHEEWAVRQGEAEVWEQVLR